MTAAAYPGEVKTTHSRNRGTMYGLVGANEKIPAGAYIAFIAGHWYNVTAATGLEGRVARCLKDVDNTGGGAGAKTIEVQLLGKRELVLVANDTTAPITAALLGEKFYWLDNATVTASNGLLTSMIARFTDIRNQFLAHAAGTGTYHGSADGATYTIAVPTTAATLYSSCTSLKTSAIAHAPKVTGGTPIHGAVDLATVGALSTLITPTTPEEARVFIETFAGIFFGSSGHTNRTSPAVHGAADATNVLTASVSAASRSAGGIAWDFYRASFGATDETQVWVEVQ